MKSLASSLALVAICFLSLASDKPARPKITGIAHVRVYSANINNSNTFYNKIAGFGPGTAGCVGPPSTCFSVNDHQQIQVIGATSPPAVNFVAEVAFTTDNADQMRRYLIAHGIAAGAKSKDADGAQHFEFADPEGHPLAFVQQSQRPSFAPVPASGQISKSLIHAGFVVRDGAVEDRFYRDLLGFRLYWQGGFKEDQTNWQAMQVPDGTDWIEYMLKISPTADHQELGVQNHFSLGVVHMKPVFEQLRANGLKSTDVPEIGRDGKMQFDIYDPDGTRVEFMEFEPSQAPCCHPFTGPHPKP
jgi:catechol 2,3-dioxygenase-like lactoylglutathione lyase family enzyme